MSVVLLLGIEIMATDAKIGPKLLVSGYKTDLILMKCCRKHDHKSIKSTLSHITGKRHTDWYNFFVLKVICQILVHVLIYSWKLFWLICIFSLPLTCSLNFLLLLLLCSLLSHSSGLHAVWSINYGRSGFNGWGPSLQALPVCWAASVGACLVCFFGMWILALWQRFCSSTPHIVHLSYN